MSIRIGTSGWDYPHWRGWFYPPELPREKWLAFYVEHFSTVEINRSFYRLPAREQFVAWAHSVGSHRDFCFAVKASRYLTHLKKLKDPEQPLERVIASARGLGNMLGPLLFQLPPHWNANRERLATVLRLIPADQPAAFEFRDASWFSPRVLDLLDRPGCALVTAIGGELPSPVGTPRIGSFSYLRFHSGRDGIGLNDAELALWSERIGEDDASKRDVYTYFNNDPEGHAISDAQRLLARLLPNG